MKQAIKRLNQIRQYCGGTAAYLHHSRCASIGRVAEFSGMLRCFYDEIEQDIVDALKTNAAKQKAYLTQSAINTLIGACDTFIETAWAGD